MERYNYKIRVNRSIEFFSFASIIPNFYMLPLFIIFEFGYFDLKMFVYKTIKYEKLK